MDCNTAYAPEWPLCTLFLHCNYSYTKNLSKNQVFIIEKLIIYGR